MYKIFGSDGNQYGPVNIEQMRQWITEGRVNAETKVQAEGGVDWKPLSEYPELAPLVSSPQAPAAQSFPAHLVGPQAYSPDYAQEASRQVQGPAIGLIVTAVLGMFSALGSLGVNLFGITLFPSGSGGGNELKHIIELQSGGLGLFQNLTQIGVGVVILVGALKMMKLENYQFAVVSAVIALVPCVSPCCLIGLPIGIWALSVLTRPEVKSMFH